MGEVIKFYPAGSAKHPDAVLEQAMGDYESVLLVGYDDEGRLDVRSTTDLDHKEILWLVESFKAKLLAGDYFHDGEEL